MTGFRVSAETLLDWRPMFRHEARSVFPGLSFSEIGLEGPSTARFSGNASDADEDPLTGTFQRKRVGLVEDLLTKRFTPEVPFSAIVAL